MRDLHFERALFEMTDEDMLISCKGRHLATQKSVAHFVQPDRTFQSSRASR